MNTQTEFDTKIHKLKNDLKDLLSLEYGWDGYSGEPCPIKCYTDSLNFLNILTFHDPLPSMGYASHEIMFVWEKDDKYLEVSFFGDNDYCYIYKDANHRSFDTRNILIYAKYDEKLSFYIQSFL